MTGLEVTMLMVLMLFCAGGAVFLIGLGAYAEFRDLHAHSSHRKSVRGRHCGRHGSN
jgi:hypothetical protein